MLAATRRLGAAERVPKNMQDALAILIALAAVAFLAWRGWHNIVKRRGVCGTCSHCPTNTLGTTVPLVNISPNKPQTHDERA